MKARSNNKIFMTLIQNVSRYHFEEPILSRLLLIQGGPESCVA